MKRFYYCPTTEREFSELTASEANCHEYLAGLRWPQGAICPHCSHRHPGTLGVGYRCRNSQCRREFQVTTGTMFERSRLTLRGWFTMIWRMVYDSKLRSAAGFRREFLSHAPKSTVAAWRYQGNLRKLMSQPPGKLTGNVEFRVLELAVRGGSKVDVWVFVQRRYNRRGLIRLKRIPNSSGEGVRVLFNNVLNKNTVLFAETWKDYEFLVSDGYVLKAASRSNLIRTDRTCDELRRFFQQSHRGGISLGSIDDYLNEFVFRFNARRSARPGYIFRTLLRNAVKMGSY